MKKLGIFKYEYVGERAIQSGFTELDKITFGWKKGELIVIGGRPAMGKTALAISLLRNIAILNRTPIAYFSLEMSTVQFMNRFLSNVSNVEINHAELYSEKEQALLDDAEKIIEDAPIFLDDTPALSIQELRTKASRLVREHQVKLIIIDYLQLMNASGMSYSNREEEVSVITRSLKALAMELNIPIIALSQLNRRENREGIDGKRPQLSDLRESRTIEQDADMICFIHRPEYYRIFQDEKGNDLHGMAEIIVAKNRNGKMEDTLLKFSSQIARFDNIS
ncbi:DnaB-like helicase C-terminal domain-containing protein [Phocaeicola vulgatus]|jgi:replicative DNA helicase|nr:DnaB-like helicase C-terminal domain-containing protein [Phocaeicola vulgatus]MCE9352542.1 DnaB-like helicase C-terminal domain-containing protein [Phocaeicola vulgatus]